MTLGSATHGRLLGAQALFERGTAPHIEVLVDVVQLGLELGDLVLEVRAAGLLALELQINVAAAARLLVPAADRLFALELHVCERLRQLHAEPGVCRDRLGEL